DAVGHYLDQGDVAGIIGESDLVADSRTKLSAELGRDSLGHGSCRNPPGLSMSDLSGNAAAKFQADLRQLGGLSRARLACYDHDLVISDRSSQVLLALTNW